MVPAKERSSPTPVRAVLVHHIGSWRVLAWPPNFFGFSLSGEPARVIHHFSGWHVPINLDWFQGSFEMPRINRTAFHWYVFAIPTFDRYRRPHYLIYDYLQMRDWVLQFSAPKGNDYRYHSDWLANVHVDVGLSNETQACFRWGDEPLDATSSTSIPCLRGYEEVNSN